MMESGMMEGEKLGVLKTIYRILNRTLTLTLAWLRFVPALTLDGTTKRVDYV